MPSGGVAQSGSEPANPIFISVTRLRVRSVRFLPFFALHTLRSLSQVRKAEGFRSGSLLPDRQWTYWTMTAWETQERMRQFMLSGAHKAAMPKLLNWCDEASVAHWAQEPLELPTWEDVAVKMRAMGRASKVRYPSPQHADLSFREPRTSRAASIRRA